MRIDVEFTYQSLDADSVNGKQVVILDIFRATSTIVTALAQGARCVFPVSSQDEAWEIKHRFPGALLAGEVHGSRISAFVLGNSPLEYERAIVQDKIIILSTTNGTKAVCKSKNAEAVYIGSFLNAQATAKRLSGSPSDIVLVCAGTQGYYSLEDTCCAGCIIDLLRTFTCLTLSDSALGALLLYKQCSENLSQVLSQSKNGLFLRTKGLEQDIRYCCRKNCTVLVPSYQPHGGFISHTERSEDNSYGDQRTNYSTGN